MTIDLDEHKLHANTSLIHTGLKWLNRQCVQSLKPVFLS